MLWVCECVINKYIWLYWVGKEGTTRSNGMKILLQLENGFVIFSDVLFIITLDYTKGRRDIKDNWIVIICWEMITNKEDNK